MHAYILRVQDGTTRTCRTAEQAARELRRYGGRTGPIEVLITQGGRTTVRSLTPTELRRLARELKRQRPLQFAD